MAVKLVFPIDSPVLDNAPIPDLAFYIKIRKLVFLPEDGLCSLSLGYKSINSDDTPRGEYHPQHPFPRIAMVMAPRELMMNSTQSAYVLAYEALTAYLAATYQNQATVTDLP